MQWPICVSHVTHSTKCIQGTFGSPGSQPAEQEGIGENKNKQTNKKKRGPCLASSLLRPFFSLDSLTKPCQDSFWSSPYVWISFEG